MTRDIVIAFDALPFHIGVADAPTNDPFPDVLPFAAAVDRRLGLLVQAPEPRIVAELDRVYRRGSMLGTPLSAEGLGRDYAEDFVRFIREVLPGGVRGLRVLEIGCGSGYLLARLKEMGADVVGIEPGDQGREGAATYGVPIVHAPFTGPDQFPGRTFDLILHHCVLEHVPDPLAFLRAQRGMLAPAGRVIVGVPDEEPYIRAGDVSTLSHEHWSFFTRSSLTATLVGAGLAPLRLDQARVGGALHALAGPSDVRSIDADGAAAVRYGRVAGELVSALERFLSDPTLRGRTVGMWPGARAFNYLHLVRTNAHVRFFDDDPRLAGKYYPPISVPVETRAQFVERPVDEMIILSRAFGERLRAELGALVPPERTRIRLLDEIGGP